MECYDHYLLTLGKNKEKSSSKKMPNLRIIKILKFFKF